MIPQSSYTTATLPFSSTKLIIEEIKLIKNFNFLQIVDCPSNQEAIDLLLNESFKESFYNNPEAIGVSIILNEKFRVLEDSELDEIEEKYSNPEKSILISLQSNIDQKFSILWRLKGKNKILILEVNQSQSEDLKEAKKFIEKFLTESLMRGESGEFSNKFLKSGVKLLT